MNWQIMLGLASLIGLIFLMRRFGGRNGRLSRRPYQKNLTLFSADDRAFFRPLKEAAGEVYEIFGKIPVSDIIVPRKGRSSDDDRQAVSRLIRRHFDFVLCDKKTLAVACVIQLRDKTNPSRQSEEDILSAICENLALPLVRFHVKAEYSTEEIREKLQKAIRQEPVRFIETAGRKEPRISSLEDIQF